MRWALSRSKSFFCWSSFLEKVKGSKSPPVANRSVKQWEKLLSRSTRESCHLSCLCPCYSMTQFAACLRGPWGCALCDLSQSQPLPPQQAVKVVLSQAALSCCHPGTASNVKWGKERDGTVISGKQCGSSAALYRKLKYGPQPL